MSFTTRYLISILIVLSISFSLSFALENNHNEALKNHNNINFYQQIAFTQNTTDLCQQLIHHIQNGTDFRELLHEDLFTIAFNTNHDIPGYGNHIGKIGLKSFIHQIYNSMEFSNTDISLQGVNEIYGLCSIRVTTDIKSIVTNKTTTSTTSSLLTDFENNNNYNNHNNNNNNNDDDDDDKRITIYLSMKTLTNKFIACRLNFPCVHEYYHAASILNFDTQLHVRNLAQGIYHFGYRNKCLLNHFFSRDTIVEIHSYFGDLCFHGTKALPKLMDWMSQHILKCKPHHERKDHHHHNNHLHNEINENDMNNEYNSENDSYDNDDNDFYSNHSCRHINFNAPFINNNNRMMSNNDDNTMMDDNNNNNNDNFAPLTNLSSNEFVMISNLIKLLNNMNNDNTNTNNNFNTDTTTNLLSLLNPLEYEYHNNNDDTHNNINNNHSDSNHHHHHHHNRCPTHNHHHSHRKPKPNPFCSIFPIPFPYITLADHEYSTANSTSVYQAVVPPLIKEHWRNYIPGICHAKIRTYYPMVRIKFDFNSTNPHKIDKITFVGLNSFGYVHGNWRK